jgi:glycosyltransferase involved in cell wall biosynthesis
MRVALVCQNFPPEFEGGTERVTLALARALRDAGDDVLVITGSDRWHAGQDVIGEDGLGVPVRRVPRKTDEGYGLQIERPRVLAIVESLLVEHRTDVVHLQHWWTLSVRILRAARARGIAVGLTVHDLWISCPRFFRRPPDGIVCPSGGDREPCAPCVKIDLKPVPLWGLRVGLADRDREIRSELGIAQFVTSPSRACADTTAQTVPWRGPIEIVPHGLLEPVRGAREMRGPHAPFRVGTVGHMVPEKGILVLVEAMAGVDGAELHLYGRFLDAAFAAAVQARAAALGVPLHTHGPYRAADVHPVRELDLAVFPSLCEETYGLVVEEALARGVPVVVSDLGALAERIGGGGVVTPAGDAAALRATIRDAIASPGRWESLRAGIPSRFSTIQDAAARYRELYRGALAEIRP